MNEKFTNKAQNALNSALEYAREMGKKFVFHKSVLLMFCVTTSPASRRGEVCGMPKPLLQGEVSPKVTERLYEGKPSGNR